jgi:hypothetical protein
MDMDTSGLLVEYSTLTTPTQVFLAVDVAHPEEAKAISSFNPIFIERAQPEWKPYQWKADDGTTVEGVLIYPPHRMGEKHLRMLTFIHGGRLTRTAIHSKPIGTTGQTWLLPMGGWSFAPTIAARAAMATISCCKFLLTWSPVQARTYWKASTHW